MRVSAPVAIPKERYLSAEHAARERERLWPRVWLHAAARELVSAPGRFVTITLGGADVLVVCAADGSVRAFHNVCQHRGRRLVDDPHGELTSLRCPLHHWRWSLEGALRSVPSRESFGDLVGEGTPRLPELACATWKNHVFVCLAAPEQSLDEWLAPIATALERWDLEAYALVDQKTFELPCNWKTIADLFNEAYHVPAVHPYLLGSVDAAATEAALHGPHAEQVFAIARPTAGAPAELTDSLRELVRDAGGDVAALRGDPANAPAVMRAALRARGVDRLSDEELLQGRSWLVFPSHTLNVYAFGAMLHRSRPHPDDPQRAWLDQLTYARLAPGASPPTPRVATFVRPGVDGDGGRVTEDDLRQAIEVQRGMRSAGFTGPRLGRREGALAHMHAGIERYLDRG